MKLVFLLKINNSNNGGVLVTLEKEDGHAQLGGAQAVDEAGDVVCISHRIFYLFLIFRYFSRRGSLQRSTSGTSGFVWKCSLNLLSRLDLGFRLVSR